MFKYGLLALRCVNLPPMPYFRQLFIIYNYFQVREINGIELLLDCSPIDGKNPYISQWVIFAIRNICLGNQENQAVLNSVSKNGTTDKQMLEEIGVQLQGM